MPKIVITDLGHSIDVQFNSLAGTPDYPEFCYTLPKDSTILEFEPMVTMGERFIGFISGKIAFQIAYGDVETPTSSDYMDLMSQLKTMISTRPA